MSAWSSYGSGTSGRRHSPNIGETTIEELRELRAAAVDGVILNDPTLAIEANRELLGTTEHIIDGSRQCRTVGGQGRAA